MGKNIFLSYTRDDHSAALELKRELEGYGHSVWIDEEQLKAGRTWWDQILEQIRTVDVVVLVVSRGYVTAEACRAEWKYAFAVKRGVLPVVIDSIRYDELPMEIAALQVVRQR